jgi:hypothetical protein
MEVAVLLGTACHKNKVSSKGAGRKIMANKGFGFKKFN